MAAKKITVVQVNDVHAYLETHQELFWEGGEAAYRPAGGYSRIAAILKQIRSEAPGRVLFADNGDTFHGTYPAVQTKGEILVPVLTRLELDAMTGHWDFAYGPEILQQRVSQLGYPFLAANVFHRDSGEPAFPSHLVKEVGDVRVGIVGLASNIVDKTMPPHFSEGLKFTLGREELQGKVDLLRGQEKVDLVILLSHLGFPQDMRLAGEVRGIDVVLSGHTHNRLFRPALQGHTIVIQSGSHGSFLGRLDLEIDSGRVAGYEHRLVEVRGDLTPDAEVDSLVSELMTPYREELSQVVGETRETLHRYTMLESTMDNLLLSAILDATGAEIAFSNGWRYGAPIVRGPITLGDLYNIIPMNPPVSMVDLTGQELVDMLEESLEHSFAGNPYDQMGGYLKRAMGIKVFLKVENPGGHRIQKLFVGGEEVRPEKSYSAAFVTVQGVPAKYGRNRRETPEKAIDVLRGYLGRHPTAESGLRGTFTLA